MLITEYRIPFPSTVDEYRVGMMYMIARASKEEIRRTGESGAIQVVRHEKFWDNEYGLGPGIYTEKVFSVRRLLPRFLRPLISEANAKVVEKSWANYPHHCLTFYFCPYLGPRPFMSVESRYLPDRGDTENALELAKEDLSARDVVTIDIAAEDKMRMTRDTDIRGVRSLKAGRGELKPGIWTRTADPVMCCYKVCRLEVPQPRLEQWGQRFMQSSFIRYNRQAFLYMDSWFGLRLADIPGALPETPEKVQTVVATELATDKAVMGLCGEAELFERADLTNPFV